MTGSHFPLFIFMLILSSTAFSQSKKEQKLYGKYQQKVQEKNYPAALEILNKFTDRFPKSKSLPNIYYQKAAIQAESGNSTEAISNLTTAYEKDSTFYEALRMRGNLYYQQEKPEAALSDYNLLISRKPDYAAAYASRGIAYQKQSRITEACEDLNLALKYGYTNALQMIQKYCDSNSVTIQRYRLQTLTTVATDESYGYSADNPVKIGMPVHREKKYLSMLLDSKGQPVKYRRQGSCCPYPSANGMFGMALCDHYEVEIDGQLRSIYITMYDYAEPMIPKGLQSVSLTGD